MIHALKAKYVIDAEQPLTQERASAEGKNNATRQLGCYTTRDLRIARHARIAIASFGWLQTISLAGLHTHGGNTSSMPGTIHI